MTFIRQVLAQAPATRTDRDRRGRKYNAPAILHYGFRPFFLLAGLHAGSFIPLWLWMFLSGWQGPGQFQGLDWHVHEMLFGYVAAVVTGFVLTAIPNWTGRFPLSGMPLAGLVALWLVGRAACGFVDNAGIVMILDLLFPVTLATVVWREIVAGRNWRNAPVAVLLTLLAAANATHHLELMGLVDAGTAYRLALGVIAMMIALIGGRITPSFTRNWLAARKSDRLPAKHGNIDKAALISAAIGVLLWQVIPEAPLAGAAVIAAGALLALRLARWKGFATVREPIVAILHLGYAWLAVSLMLLGGSILWPGQLPATMAIHALTSGAVGTMTLAVMTRASLGHTGRAIHADHVTRMIYLLVSMGALLRVSAPMSHSYEIPLAAGGLLWSMGFLLFVLRYGPILCKARLR